MSSLANPLVALALGTAGGLYLSHIFREQKYGEILVLVPMAAFLLASLGISLLGRPLSGLVGKRGRFSGIWVLLAAAGLFSGLVLGRDQARQEASGYFGLPREKIRRVEGLVQEDSRPGRGGRHRAILRVRSCFDGAGNQAGAWARLLVFLPREERLFWGDRVLLEGDLGEGQSGAELFFVSPGSSLAPERGNPLLALRADVLQRSQRGIRGIQEEWTGLFAALFLGLQDDLDPWISDAFRGAGVVHVLALSGMHLGILVVLVQSLLRPLVGAGLGGLICCGLVGLYTFIAGPRPSLLRAALMYLLYQGLVRLGRRPETLSLLAFSFLASCLLTPGDLFSASFILSYLAMGGILVFSRRLRRLLLPWVPDPLGSALAVSLAAQTATAPYLLASFGLLQPAALPASIILGPLTTAFLWMGIPGFFLAGLSGSVGMVVQGLLHPMQYLYTAIVATASFFSRFPPWGVR